MCFLSGDDRRHLKALLWRFKILFGRKRTVAINIFYNVFLMLGFAVLFRQLNPPTVVPESDNFDMMITFGTAGF